MSRRLVPWLLALSLLLPCLPTARAGGDLDPSTRKDARRAIDIGLAWLKDKQQADGHWSLAQYPAITALAARGYLERPGRVPGQIEPNVQKALDYILSCVREDGGIYRDIPQAKGGGLRNYNTALCMDAIAATGLTKYDPIVLKAREFLVKNQHLVQDDYYGGWGYDEGLNRPYADVVNTTVAVEALNYTTFIAQNSCAPPVGASTKDQAPKTYADANWNAAVDFLSRCQNLPSKGEDKAVSPRPEDRGGFYYEPHRGMVEGEKDAEGRQVWHSYGNATYGGLMCFLCANLDRSDPRVQGAADWIRRHYTVTEHPGLGNQGLYFYYRTMSMALFLYGEDPLKLADGKEAEWRRDMITRIVSIQRIDPQTGQGYWMNDEGRWMENDPVLVTSYSILALEILLQEDARGVGKTPLRETPAAPAAK